MKKLSQRAKVAKLWETDPAITPKQMSEKLGIPPKRIYVLRAMVKKAESSPSTTTQFKDVPVSRPANYYQNLEAENRKLTEWTMLWKQKYDKLEQDYTQAKVMYLNSEAVVQYLERKVLDLLNSRGE